MKKLQQALSIITKSIYNSIARLIKTLCIKAKIYIEFYGRGFVVAVVYIGFVLGIALMIYKLGD